MESAESKPGVAWLFFKLALFTFFVPGSVTAWIPLFWLRPELRHEAFLAAIPGIAGCLLLLGIAGYVWCALDFLFQGQGTPAPIDPPKTVVHRGLYKYTRNPMYISVLLIILGENIVFRSWFLVKYGAIVAAIFHFWVMVYEEPTLRASMGESSLQYCDEVPRWIPKLAGHQGRHAV